jgi:hypothetical protein
MKRTIAITLLALAGVVGTGKALAQNQQIRATVPFDFTVGSKTLPAGTYSITRVSDDAIAIRDHDARFAVLSMTSQATNQPSKNVLVFDRYDGHYFLRDILCESAAMNVSLPWSKSEAHAREQEAKNPTDGGQVLLALDK